MHDSFDSFLRALGMLPEPIRAAIIAFFMAMLRILYDNKEPRWVRRVLESSLCGTIALAATHAVMILGMSKDWGVFLGGFIGLMGADKVREWGRRVADKRLR